MNVIPSHDFLDSLGWTLVHFLWQGLIIAALAAAALRLLRRHSANVRYFASCFALLLMAAAPVATFYSLNRAEENPAPAFTVRIFDAADTTVESPRPTTPPARAAVAVAPKPIARKATFPEILEAALPWLVAAWSVGVLALSCRLFAGWLFIQKLRHSATLIDPLQAKLKQLAARIGVSRPVRLLQSAFVEVPAVIGWLRPVILLPASCLAGLTPAQLESILAHELAHIRRHDYLVNLLQNVVETLLFYHPAVWWVSRRIRQEREHCCDDLAVKICGDPLEYARALATLEELRPAPAQLQLAAAGAPLLERIRRLAGQPERTALRPAWPVAGFIAILLLALLAAGLRNNPASAQSAAEPPATNQLETLSTPTNVTTPPSPAQTFTSQLTKLPPATNHLSQTDSSSVQPTNLPAPRSEPHFVSQLTKLSPRTNSAASAKAAPAPQVVFEVKLAEVDVSKTGTNGFTWLFKDLPAANLVSVPAKYSYIEYFRFDPTNTTESTNATVTRNNSLIVPLGMLVSSNQYKEAINILEQQDGRDILTLPKSTSEMGSEVRLLAGETIPIITGGPPPGQAGSLPPYTNVTVGSVVDLVPRLSADGRSMELAVNVSINEFAGYDDATSTNGTPLPKGWNVPHIRRRQFLANATIGDGQTLVLGGPPSPVTNKKEPKRSVLGRLFHKKTAATVNKTLLVFITPQLINQDGTPYHSAGAANSTGHLYSPNGTNLVHTSKGRRAIMDKLNSLRVDDVAYDYMPLDEVINDLAWRVKKVDPDGKGIPFLISRESPSAASTVAPGAIDPATGLPAPAISTTPPLNINSVLINIDPALKNARLADVLAAITKSGPIKYSVLDYAVVFSRRDTNEPPPLEIRAFHINSNKFREHLEDLNGLPRGALAVTNTTNGFSYASSNNSDALQISIRKFFGSVGVDFNTNNPATLGKAFVWNSRKGILTVRATAADLDLLAAAIETLNLQPLVVTLQIKAAVVAVQSNTDSKFFAGSSSFDAGVLGDPQYQTALRTLEQREGVQFLSNGQVFSINPNRTVTGVHGILTNDTRQLSFAAAVDVTSRVAGQDDRRIDLTVVSEIPEVSNFYNGAHPPTDMEGNPLRIAGPYSGHSQSYTNNLTVFDGQTFAFSTPYPYDLPLATVSTAKKSVPAHRPNWNVMFFVTPTLMNPDGTPYHNERQRASFQTNTPVPAK